MYKTYLLFIVALIFNYNIYTRAQFQQCHMGEIPGKNVSVVDCSEICILGPVYNYIDGKWTITTPNETVHHFFFEVFAYGEQIDAHGADYGPTVYDGNGKLVNGDIPPNSEVTVYFYALLTGELPVDEEGFVGLILKINDPLVPTYYNAYCVTNDVVIQRRLTK